MNKLVKEKVVKLRLHIGGAWHVVVTSGYRGVDLRKFFLSQEGKIKPMKAGIALHPSEWDRIKQIAEDMKEIKSLNYSHAELTATILTRKEL